MVDPQETTKEKESIAKGQSSALDRYYNPDDPELKPETIAIFSEYVGIPEAEIIPHIRTIRDKAWSLFKYPCIGHWSFLDFSISCLPEYPTVLRSLSNPDTTLLDLGCCFAQDIRKLIHDGAPATSLTALELEAGFLDLGYELFRDKGKLESKLVAADFFKDVVLEDGSFDFIHAGAFFHLFSWEEQLETLVKAVRLLKSKPGSLIFGRQTGTAVAGTHEYTDARSGNMWRHDEESFRRLVAEAAVATGRKLDAEVEAKDHPSLPGDWTRLRFCIIVL